MNKYIRKDKHFRYLYNKTETKYFYNKFFLEFNTLNKNFLSIKDLNNLVSLLFKKYKKYGRYRSKINNRCLITGRANIFYSKKFRLNRSLVRSLISSGKFPGIRKASW